MELEEAMQQIDRLEQINKTQSNMTVMTQMDGAALMRDDSIIDAP